MRILVLNNFIIRYIIPLCLLNLKLYFYDTIPKFKMVYGMKNMLA